MDENGGRASARSEARARTLRAAALMGVAAYCIPHLIYLYRPAWVLAFPNWFWPGVQPWWWPFRPQDFAFGAAPLALGILGAACILYAAARCHALGLRRLVGSLLLGCLLVHSALLLAPGRGLTPYAIRLVLCAHHEFFIRSALSQGVVDTLVHYEEQMRDGAPAILSRQKGPANMATHVALHRIANAPGLRAFFDWNIERAPELFDQVYPPLRREWGRPDFGRAEGGEVLRSFLLMPFFSVGVRVACTLAAFLLGAAFFDRRGATLVAIAVSLLPATSLEFVQMDGSVFPLLFILALALFFYGDKLASARLVTLAGIVTALHLYFTLSAVVTAGICSTAAALESAGAFLQQRRQPAAERVRAATAKLANIARYWLGLAATLVFARVALSFHVIERYADARGLQSRTRGPGHEWGWLLLNSVEFFLTLGPLLTACAAIGMALAIGRWIAKGPQRVGIFSLALLLNFALLLGLGSNSEVYRLWAFLGAAFAVPAVYAVGRLGRDALTGAVAFSAALLLWLTLLTPHFGWVG